MYFQVDRPFIGTAMLIRSKKVSGDCNLIGKSWAESYVRFGLILCFVLSC